MSLFGRLPDRPQGNSSALFDDPPTTPPKKSTSSGLFGDDNDIDNEPRSSQSHNVTAPDPTQDTHEQQSQTLPMNKPTYAEDPASDPWGTSPVQPKEPPSNGYHTQQSGQRTTSSYTTTSDTLVDQLGGPGFGDSMPQDMPPAPRARQHRTDNEEVLSVSTLPDKEGMFLFQHRNYEVSSNKRSSTVIRRYSDFVWLLECLHKRYPFRQLPLLPPKRVSINGNHLAADGSFIEKRRRGLARFVNTLTRHPVLKEEQLVTMFLTVPTELAAWRKQASISVQEEFVGRALPPTLEDSLPVTLEDLFGTVRAGVSRSAEAYINLCNLVERLVRRREGVENEYGRVSAQLRTLTEASSEAFSLDTNDVPLLNEGIAATADHLVAHQRLLAAESRAWDSGVLEDFKRQRDCLVSMRDLFARRDLYAKDTIPALERRIAGNEDKLAKVRAKQDYPRQSDDARKIEDAIVKDKQSIVDQHARGVFIKECVRDEIRVFMALQYDVGRAHQDWMADRARDADAQADNWRACAELVENMPTSVSA